MLSSGQSSLFCSSPIPTSSPFNLPPSLPSCSFHLLTLVEGKLTVARSQWNSHQTLHIHFLWLTFKFVSWKKIKIDFLSPTSFFISPTFNFVGFSLPVNVDFSVAAVFFIHQSSNNNIQSTHSPPTLALCTLCFNSFVVFFLLSSNHQPDVTSAQCSFSIKNKGGFYTLCYFHSTLTPAYRTLGSLLMISSTLYILQHHARHWMCVVFKWNNKIICTKCKKKVHFTIANSLVLVILDSPTMHFEMSCSMQSKRKTMKCLQKLVKCRDSLVIFSKCTKVWTHCRERNQTAS